MRVFVTVTTLKSVSTLMETGRGADSMQNECGGGGRQHAGKCKLGGNSIEGKLQEETGKV